VIAPDGARITPERTPRAPSVLLIACWYTLCWLPLAALYGVAIYLQAGGGMSIRRAAIAGLLNVASPWALGWIVWWGSGRLTLPTRRIPIFIAIHVGGGVAFATVWAGAVFAEMVTGNAFAGANDMLLRTVIPWQWLTGLLVYVMIAGISYTIRGMRRSRDLQIANERAERLRLQAELQALRAHINPHFLFNALHAVTQLLHTDPARAELALERLSTLFRYALRLDREQIEVVTLEEEWAFAKDYLWLEQLRLGDRLSVVEELDDDALECVVPPFSLQPLLENAIRHGIAPRAGAGCVTVRISESEGRVHLSVMDDGAGSDAPVSASRGIGLRAVTQRLHARFGAAARHRITTAPGDGFRIELEFPAERARVAITQ
jgi:two-component system, LytTR family, sensor kinase